MINEKKMKEAFSALHASEYAYKEVMKMTVEKPKMKKSGAGRRTLMIAAVAVVAVLAMAATALAVTYGTVHITETDNGDYIVDAPGAKKLTDSEFDQDTVEELGSIFVDQYAADALDPYDHDFNYDPDKIYYYIDPDNVPAGFDASVCNDSQYAKDPNGGKTMPGAIELTFASAAEAAEYIGCDALIIPDWAREYFDCHLIVEGNENGEIEDMILYNQSPKYVGTGDVALHFFAIIYTEASPYEPSFGNSNVFHKGVDYTESHYTSPRGLDCTVVTSMSDADANEYADTCYIVDSGILYKVELWYTSDGAQEAETILRLWIEMF